MLHRTPYTERRLAGHYDPPGAKKKTAAERKAQSTTTDKLEGLGTPKGKTKSSPESRSPRAASS